MLLLLFVLALFFNKERGGWGRELNVKSSHSNSVPWKPISSKYIPLKSACACEPSCPDVLKWNVAITMKKVD